MTEKEQLEKAIADAWATAEAAREQLAKDGVVVHNSHGDRKHPAFQIWRDSITTWNRLRGQAARVEEEDDAELASLIGF